MEESSEQKYDRLQREIQTEILKGFPNPERKGCPGRTAIQRVAKDPDHITVEDDADPKSTWYHITHCSPCYAEFLELRTAYRVERAKARLTRRAAIFASLGVVGISGWLLSQNRTRTVDIDFEKYVSTRGVGEGPAQHPPTIPTGKVLFRLKLSKDSGTGLYSVRLSKEPNLDSVFETAVSASSRADRQELEFVAPVHAASGRYTLAVRNDHSGWRYCPVLIQSRPF
jgi:hypothetical protein